MVETLALDFSCLHLVSNVEVVKQWLSSSIEVGRLAEVLELDIDTHLKKKKALHCQQPCHSKKVWGHWM